MNETRLTRRRFVAAAGFGGIGLSGGRLTEGIPASANTPRRKFYMVLSLGRLGFKSSFEQSVELAVKYGFEGVDPDLTYFAGLDEGALRRRLDDLKTRNLKLGAAGLTVEFRKDEQTFSDGLKNLPATAEILERAGVTRVSTYILPFSEHLTYLQNFRAHACRLRACAEILQDHGQRLGLEYVSPRTLWRGGRHPFVHTLSEMKELNVAIGTDNLGFQLDTWHWFNAQETEMDLLTLRSRDVITVDMNDAPAGLTLDTYVDSARELPATTGVISVKSFLDALVQIGYEGPVQAEPFNAALRSMPIEQACAATAAAMRKAFSTAGLG
jgi:sugar phosphate isomerase/epimerase